MTSDLPSRIQPVVINLLREILAEGRAVTFLIRGDSMVPTLNPGDRITVVPLDLSKLRPGDLLVYVSADYDVITHRLVSMDGDYAILRGDNKTQDDPPVHISRILGKVEKWEPASSD